jgi:hypothetical protein
MGYSYSLIAGATLDAVRSHCLAQTGTQNAYTHKGKSYFFDSTRTEHADGSITGSVWRMNGNMATRSGSFRIDGRTGRITTWSARPVPWVSLADRFRELSARIFAGASFAEIGGTPEEKEYNQLLPHWSRLRRHGLA